ncbi:hypothetical protein IGI04_042447, partial [Brassica rapa subsp. trilocularis]
KSHAGHKLLASAACSFLHGKEKFSCLYLLQLLVAFFMGRKSSAACAAWCAEACHQLSNLIFVFCGSKPSSEATPYDIKYPLLSSGHGQGEYSDQLDPCDGSEPRVIQNLIVYSLSRKSRITVNWSCDMDQGHEDTMMGSHPGGRVTACSVGCSILKYLMEMMVTSRWETFTLGREGTALASVRVPYDISPCPDELTIRYCFLGLKSLEWYPIGVGGG